jgi:hypothetical protein
MQANYTKSPYPSQNRVNKHSEMPLERLEKTTQTKKRKGFFDL